MQFDNFRQGLDILAKYFDDVDGYPLAADHDVFFVMKTDRPLSPDDVVLIKKLGWFQEGLGNDDHALYDSEVDWKCFV